MTLRRCGDYGRGILGHKGQVDAVAGVVLADQRGDGVEVVGEYLPGDEYTVLMLANGENQEFLPGIVYVDPAHFRKYPILRSDLRGVGITKIHRPESRIAESIAFTKQAVTTLNCLDHVRVDMRVGADDKLKIIEVNGIPGLKPIKSWSPQIYSLYHASPEGVMEEYRQLVHLIVGSGLNRYGLV